MTPTQWSEGDRDSWLDRGKTAARLLGRLKPEALTRWRAFLESMARASDRVVSGKPAISANIVED